MKRMYEGQKHRSYGMRNLENHRVIKDKKNNIYIPPSLQKHVMEWYNTILQHPGFKRTYKTIN